MKRRYVMLITFALLTVIALVVLQLRPAPQQPPPQSPTLPVARPTTPHVAVPSEPAVTPLVAFEHDAGRATWPRELESPMRALEPVLRTCINEAPHVELQSLTARFRPTRDGGFDQASLETPVADPQLRACLEDAFSEVVFTLNGAERFEPVSVTLVFDRSAK